MLLALSICLETVVQIKIAVSIKREIFGKL